MRLLTASALALCALSVACKRPVVGADSGETLVFDLEVDPQFIRADVPVDIRYRVSGALPEKVTYDIGGMEFSCEPDIGGDGRFTCTHPGIGRDELPQGTTLVVLEGTDDKGRTSIATTQVTIDFDCPVFASLTVTPQIAEPDQTVVLSIEATEALREPPIVSRQGIAWTEVQGSGSSYSVSREIGVEDPAALSNIVVRLIDRAGNSSTDCGEDGRIEFGVDHSPPGIDPSKIMIERFEPGIPATITAESGAFFDDVGVAQVLVHDELGQIVASITPDENGAIPASSLGGPTGSRVTVEAVDLKQRVSPSVTVPERWRLSVGAGTTPNAAVRTAARLTPAPANTGSMANRTPTFAPNIREPDARSAVVRAQVGFHKVGDLPSRYEDAHLIIGGYDVVGKNILAVGGHQGRNFNLYASYMSDALVLHWDEDEGAYIFEDGPQLDISDPELPDPRYGSKIAFNGQGCGAMFGGRVVSYRDGDPNDRRLYSSNGAFELCFDETTRTYDWRRINYVTAPGDDDVTGRVAPITWDPDNNRYVMVGGIGQGSNDRVRFLVPPQPGQSEWQLLNVAPLPTNFQWRSNHFQFFDPRLGGVTIGSGGIAPIGNGEHALMWTYLNGQWQASTVPNYMWFRQAFGQAFDKARQQVLMWGGNTSGTLSDPEVFFMTKSSTNAEDAFRFAELDAPVARDYPTLVYDEDREVTVVFGGIRFSADERWVPPEIHQIVTQPSYPYLQASVDLDAQRPKGIERIELTIGASGLGDGDSIGPGTLPVEGVLVTLWDNTTRTWVEVGSNQLGGTIEITVVDNPDRFVLPNGVVPITVRSRYPATEALDARLEVDVIDGTLYLRPGVTL